MKATIVGGGFATAVAFHRRGHQVEVLERAAASAEVGAGLTIQPNRLFGRSLTPTHTWTI